MILDYNEIDLSQYENNLIKEDTITKDLEINPFGKYLFYVEDKKIIGYIYYSDIYDRAEINQIEVDVSHRNCGKASILLKKAIRKGY